MAAILQLKSTPSYTWNVASRSYRAGRSALTQAEVRGYVDAAISSAKSQARQIAESYLSHRNSAEFEVAMKTLIRNEHNALAMIANGGRAQMTPELWGRVGNVIKAQYQYLEAFGRQIDAGLISDAAMVSRAELYAGAGVNTYESFTRDGMADIGMREALNVLGGGNHCGECPELSSAGWMPIDEMPMPGARLCLGRCLCSVEYR